MLWAIYEVFYNFESLAYSIILNLFRPLISLWNNLWVEWLLLQSIIIYTLFRLYNTVNYLKQVLALMGVVITFCLYLSLWQLELFACFLFLGEFTILIFFYCLFLHLKASINQNTSSHNVINQNMIVVVSTLIFILWMWAHPFLNNYNENQIAYSIDLYRITSDFLQNDLASLYFYFTTGNLSIHFLIGIILFVLTLFLFTAVTFYTSANILRKAAFKSAQTKLFTPRGYYEQTGEFSQKYFSQNNPFKK